jgi:hypothetical protein
MLKRFLLAILMVVVSTGLAWAQSIQIGDYEMDWAILHNPVSSDLPTLEAGTAAIRLQSASGVGACPPTSAYVVFDAPASKIMGGTTTWCIKSDGTFDGAANSRAVGRWNQYTETHAIIEVEQGSRANDKVMAVAVLQAAPPPPPPPPPGPVKVFITQPTNGATVSGTVWVVMWAEGTSGSSNVFTLSVDGKVIRPETTSSRGPVTIPWFTVNNPDALNGTHTLTATVRDATGNTGTTSITVIVKN